MCLLKIPLAPYGLTRRYPAGMSCFIINNAKCYYPYNNRNIFPSIKCCASYYKAFIKTSTLPPTLHYLLSLPPLPSPALLGTTYHLGTGALHIGPGAWSSWGRRLAGSKVNRFGSSTHQRGGPRRSPSEHSDRLCPVWSPPFGQSPSRCAVSFSAVLLELPSL